MSHKRRRGGQDGVGGDKRSRRGRKHLYLILDDWEKGFSVHKIDVDTFDSDSDDQSMDLPEPPALRLEAHTNMSFAAMGSKIFVFTNQSCALIYDAETGGLSVGAHAPAPTVYGCGISVPVGEVLYTLMYRHLDTKHPHSFEAMSWGPCTAPLDDDDHAMARRPHLTDDGGKGCWSWKPLPPPTTPFKSYVHSYALHPDGRTIFITSSNDENRINGMGTYSFNTIDSVWRFHGNWFLPFYGEGHFDGELDAWVGVDRNGYICACQVVSPSFQSTAPCFYPDCKMTKETMFSKTQRHMRASLTYMEPSKFCLVQCVAAKKVEKRQPTYGSHGGCVLHLTMFGLKYNCKGELQIRDHRSTRSFIVSRHRDHFVPAAFWM